MVYDGHVEKGIVVVDAAVNLPDGMRVKVEIPPVGGENLPEESVPTLYEQLRRWSERPKGCRRTWLATMTTIATGSRRK